MFQAQEQKIERSSPLYPQALRGVEDAPEAVYAVGNLRLLNERLLGVVGARRTPLAACKTGREICKRVAPSIAVLTGLSGGADIAAIEGALDGGGRVVCLLAGGLGSLPQTELPLIKRVCQSGLLVALHPYDTPVRTFSYEYRNRMLAQLCEGLLVLGAGEQSGALISAKYMSELQKPIFALPYPPNSAYGCGCNGLIKRGAYLTERAEDIGAVLRFESASVQTQSLTQNERALLSALQTLGEAHISAIAAEAGLPLFKAQAILSSLEVKGLACGVGGNRFSPV